jgi:hypothetical protein
LDATIICREARALVVPKFRDHGVQSWAHAEIRRRDAHAINRRRAFTLRALRETGLRRGRARASIRQIRIPFRLRIACVGSDEFPKSRRLIFVRRIHEHHAGDIGPKQVGVKPHVHAAAGVSHQDVGWLDRCGAQQAMQVVDGIGAGAGAGCRVAESNSGTIVGASLRMRGDHRLHEPPHQRRVGETRVEDDRR